MLDAVIDFLPSPLDVPPMIGLDPRTGGEIVRTPDDKEPLQRPRLQDRRRPVRRQAGVLPGLLGHAQGRARTCSTRQGQEGAHRAHPPDARQPPRGDRGGLRGRHRRGRRAEGHLHRRHPVRPGPPDHPRVDDLPRAGHRGQDRAEDEGRPGQARARPPAPGRGGSDLPRPHRPGDGETLIAGMGELHLDVLVDRMVREFKVAANVGKPQVSYRETIRRAAEGNGRFVRQTGGKGQYGHAVIKLEPAEKGTGYEFVDKIVGGTIPREYIKPVDQGIRETLATGIYAGYPMVDVKVTALRRVVPRRRLVGDGVQDRRFDGDQGCRREGRPGHPRADHEGRGPHARGVHGRRHRRPQQPPRPDRGDGVAGIDPGRPRVRARSPRCSGTSRTCGP